MSKKRGRWPDRAVEKVDQPLAEWPAAYPRFRVPRITWGYANKEAEAEEAQVARPVRQPEALLDYCNRNYELRLAASGAPDLPDECTLSTRFAGWPELDPDAEPVLPAGDVGRLFNVLACCPDGVRLRLGPDLTDTRILVFGVTTTVPVEALTARLLYDAFARLHSGTSLAGGWLLNGQGDDHWGMNGGDPSA